MSMPVLSTNDNNLELFSLLWLKDRGNIPNDRNVEQKLRAIINHFKEFHDVKECQQYIEQRSKQDRLILIVSDQSGIELVSSIHKLRQVLSIYIYGKEKNDDDDESWTSEFVKIKAIVVEVDELVSRIKIDLKVQMREEEPLSMSMLNTGKSAMEINGQFVFSQVLIDCLLRLKSDAIDHDEFISSLKNEYEGNSSELIKVIEFQETYTSNKALWWYTRDSFFYKILNAALRKQDIHMILLYKSFISDIHRQLQYHQSKCPVRVYRSQLMSIDELEYLEQYIGQFVSMNSFLSTSNQRPVALFYMGDTTQRIDLERVLFEIEADPKVVTTKPFADISTYSCFDMDSEVLFMLGSVFRLNKITHEDNHIWLIQMTLCSDEEHDLKPVLMDMKNQNGIGETNFHTLGKLLWNMGKLDLAEKYYTRLVNELSLNDPLLNILHAELSKIASQQGDYDKSVQLHKKSLEIKNQLPSSTDITNKGLQIESSIGIDPLTIRKLIYRTVTTIKETVGQVKANKNQCKRLEERIETITSVLKCINDSDLQRSEFRRFLMNFCICIEQCLAFVTKFQDDTLWFFKVFNSIHSKDQFEKLNAQLVQCVSDLNLDIDLKHIFDHKQDVLDQQNDLHAIQFKLDEIASMMIQQQQEQLRHLPDIKENTKPRHNSYKHRLEENIVRATDPVKAKKLIDREHSFLRIPYYDLVQEEQIGQGGFADVFRGRWLSQNREVAIKFIRIQYLGEKVKEDFIKEISTMQQIRHEHVLTMYGACMEPEKYALVVEYMSLGSLYDVLRRETIQLTWSDRWLIALQMIKGIHCLHTLPKPIIHRDIKSHNILMTKRDRRFFVKIGDFGLAKIRHETSKQSVHGPVVGTLAWKAPELLVMGKHTEASDVYALGIVLWELATGCEPYEDADDQTISAFVRGGDRLNIPADVPESFVQLIIVAWAQEPKQRFSCQQLLQLLKERDSDPLDIIDEIEENTIDSPQPASLTSGEIQISQDDNVHYEMPMTNSRQLTTNTTAGYEETTAAHFLRLSDVVEEPNVLLMPITGYAKMPLVSLEIAIEPLIALFPAIQNYAYIAKERCKNSANGLTVAESASIVLYTMGWEPLEQCLYFVLNRTLRSKNRMQLKPWFSYLKLFLTALSHLPSQSRIVYRGVRMDMSKQYVKGQTVIWWGFSSCTSKIDVLETDLFLGKAGIRTIFAIECYSGKDIGKHSWYSTENEILLPAATQFLVIGHLDHGHDLHMIQLRETQPKFPLLEPLSTSGATARSSPQSTLFDNSLLGPPDKYIFLSYENDDKLLIDTIANMLTDAGGNVWTDDMIDNHEETNIADAIENTWVFICFPTSAYQNSSACRTELCFAQRREKKIIPIMTKSNWQPGSWLAMVIASLPCFKWEDVQPEDVQNRIPDLVQRLRDLASGSIPRTRGAISRNYTLESRSQTNLATQQSGSVLPRTARTGPNV